jgi:hypothetical protein
MATVNLFPYDITDLDEKTSDQLSEHFSGNLSHLVHHISTFHPFSGKPDKLVQVGPEKMLILAQFRHEIEKYYTFKIKESDIFVAGFPRSGFLQQPQNVLSDLTQSSRHFPHQRYSLVRADSNTSCNSSPVVCRHPIVGVSFPV